MKLIFVRNIIYITVNFILDLTRMNNMRIKLKLLVSLIKWANKLLVKELNKVDESTLGEKELALLIETSNFSKRISHAS